MDQMTIVRKEIAASREAGHFFLYMLQTGFDVARLVADCQAILSKYAVVETARADGTMHRSISLTHRVGAVDPARDGSNTQFNPETNEKLFFEQDFTEFYEGFKTTIFFDVYSQMPFRIGRMRLNILPALTVFGMHFDSAPRAHIAIVTNPNCFLVSGDGQAFHVPADGNVYIFDTTTPHTAFNSSRKDRIHLTMALADEE